MKVVFEEKKVFIDTYPEAAREELPIFAENRVHQRTSGNPYPNKVVLEANRKERRKQEYTLLTLENDFLEIGILPALGGKILYATDKKSGCDLFYHNHVIKPALIGVLGSWTSGGVEFNWPFHHRASTFMPVDYTAEYGENEVTVWLSEHDPIDRMKGMVGICLKEGECVFETKVKLDNSTPLTRSFLWWENAAVPVGEHYSIFFPEDVNYVRFHYKRSVTPYPIADTENYGFYNGFPLPEGADISQHKNTCPATSYFSAESKFDYFGGYDSQKQAGVVHIADHHISPGKKMFTWGYRQLERVWENALTDTDGMYAELMAGCYSDNQPDFSFIAPYETKSFSQSWFPIHGMGAPVVANRNGALFEKDGMLYFQSLRPEENVHVSVCGQKKTMDFPAYECVPLFERKKDGDVLLAVGTRELLSYTFRKLPPQSIPAPRKELPYFKEVESAQTLYLEGVHMWQYRSPEYRAETCFLESLKRDKDYLPSLLALSKLNIEQHDFSAALSYADKAIALLTEFNSHPESGRAFYLKGLALLGMEHYDDAYDAMRTAAFFATTGAPIP